MNRILTLARYEVARWTRTRYLLALTAWFVVSGLISPLTVRYADKLFGAASSGNVTITVVEGTWTQGLDSYLKNASQISLLLSVVLVSIACSVSRNSDLGTYYFVRTRSGTELFGPRLAVSALAVACAGAVGAVCAAYESAVLFPDIDWAAASSALGIQIVAIVAISLIAGCVAALTGRALPAAVIVLGAYYLVAVLGARLGRWAPAQAVRPSDVLAGGSVTAVWPSVAVLVVLGAALLTVVALRPLQVDRIGRSGPPMTSGRPTAVPS